MWSERAHKDVCSKDNAMNAKIIDLNQWVLKVFRLQQCVVNQNQFAGSASVQWCQVLRSFWLPRKQQKIGVTVSCRLRTQLSNGKRCKHHPLRSSSLNSQTTFDL